MMKRILMLVVFMVAVGKSEAQMTNHHLIGADLSTITGSGLMYRYLEAPWGLKASTYLFSDSDLEETDFNIGGALQYNIAVKPLTRLYTLLGGAYRGNYTDHYDHSLARIGIGFGAELRAFQAAKNEDLIFIMEIAESYIYHRQERLSDSKVKRINGFIITFSVGVGIEF